MNKWLLVWNIILTTLMVGMVVSGCSSLDPQFTNLQEQVKSNRAAIEQLANAVNEDRQDISENTQSIAQLKLYTETILNQFQATLQGYVNK